MKKKYLVILVCGIVALLAVGRGGLNSLFNSPNQIKSKVIYKVTKDVFPITVAEKGILEPKEVKQLFPKNMFKDQKEASPKEGVIEEVFTSDDGLHSTAIVRSTPASTDDLPLTKFTIMRITPKGTKVNKGDILVEFDHRPVKEMMDQIQKELKDLRDNYEQYLNNLRTQKEDLTISIDRARLALDQTLKDYDSLWEEAAAGKISEDSLDFQSRLLQAKEQRIALEKVECEHRIVCIVLKEYDIPPEQAIKKEQKPKPKKEGPGGRSSATINGQDISAEDLNDILSGLAESGVTGTDEKGNPVDLGNLLNTLGQSGNLPGGPGSGPASGSLLPQGSAYYPETLRNEPPEVASRYLKPIVDIIKNIEDRQKKFESLLKYPRPLALYAPSPGYVFHGSGSPRGWWVREADIKEGSAVQLNQPVVYVSNTLDMKVTINVGEDDISKIKKGQKAKVHPTAFRNLVLNGEVAEISEVPVTQNPYYEAPTGNEGRYPVTINLSESDPRLRPKINTEVEIICQEIKDAIFVPAEAIFKKTDTGGGESKEKKVCYILRQSKPVEVEVKTGKRNDHFIIIEEGLKQGDEVFLYDPFLKK